VKYRLVLLAAVLMPTVASVGAAQSGAIRATLGSARVERPAVGADTLVALGGVVWGLQGAVVIGPATLAIRYAQGTISPSGNGTSTDLVDGEVILWLAPVRWAALGVGPHARAFVENGGTDRWLLWEVRVRSGTDVIGHAAGVYIEGWRVLGASVPVVDPFDHGWGMEGGISVAFGRLPFSAQLFYRVEQQVVASGARRETQDQLVIAVGVGRR
jgi:hypothetical protein